MGLFDKIGEAKAKQDGDYMEAGNYLMRIDRVKQDQNRQKQDLVAVEMTVLKVLGTEEGKKAHKPGESVTRIFPDYGKSKDYFLPEVKAFICAATGCDETEVNGAAVEAIVDPKTQPLAGTIVEVHNKTKLTQQGEPRVRTSFKRSVSFTAILKKVPAEGGLLDENEIKRFWKPGELESLASSETAPAAAA